LPVRVVPPRDDTSVGTQGQGMPRPCPNLDDGSGRLRRFRKPPLILASPTGDRPVGAQREVRGQII
jgi:hypothetical protein